MTNYLPTIWKLIIGFVSLFQKKISIASSFNVNIFWFLYSLLLTINLEADQQIQ